MKYILYQDDDFDGQFRVVTPRSDDGVGTYVAAITAQSPDKAVERFLGNGVGPKWKVDRPKIIQREVWRVAYSR